MFETITVAILLVCLKIFFARIVDVSLGTIRMILIVKGKTLLGSIIAFLEILIWFMIAREALNTDFTSILIPISYAGGFAAGTLVGSFLSEKFIDGILTVQVITSNEGNELINAIRKSGYGVTVIDAEGHDETVKRKMLFIEIGKRQLPALKTLVKETDTKAFIVVNESKYVQNGYFLKNKN